MEVQHAADRRVGVGEASRIAQLSPDTIRRAALAGKLPFSRTPGGQRRFRVADVEALSSNSPAPASAATATPPTSLVPNEGEVPRPQSAPHTAGAPVPNGAPAPSREGAAA